MVLPWDSGRKAENYYCQYFAWDYDQCLLTCSPENESSQESVLTSYSHQRKRNCHNHHWTKCETKAQRGEGHCYSFLLWLLQITRNSVAWNKADLPPFSSGGQKSNMGLTGLKWSVCRAVVFWRQWQGLGRLQKKIFPCLFQLLEAAHIPWLTVPFMHLQTQQCRAKSFSGFHPFVSFLPSSSTHLFYS